MSLLLWLKAWKKLSTFGANIAITPKRESLQISCGGIPLGNALVDNGTSPWPEHCAPSRAFLSRTEYPW